MKNISNAILLLFLSASLSLAQTAGVGGLVSGDVQKVGFRAFVLRQAIAQNLGGWTVNLSDGRVSFSLYGDPDGIQQALREIAKGPDRSAVKTLQTWKIAAAAPATFTVFAWTSESRDLHKPLDLVFQRRPDHSVLDEHHSKKVYHEILKAAGVDP